MLSQLNYSYNPVIFEQSVIHREIYYKDITLTNCRLTSRNEQGFLFLSNVQYCSSLLLSNFSFIENSFSLIIIIRLLLFLDYLVGSLLPFVEVVQLVIF